MAISIETETRKLDGLLALLRHCSASETCELVEEHLQDARTYLLGAMSVECRLNLELALEASSRIPDAAVRAESRKVLRELIDDDA